MYPNNSFHPEVAIGGTVDPVRRIDGPLSRIAEINFTVKLTDAIGSDREFVLADILHDELIRDKRTLNSLDAYHFRVREIPTEKLFVTQLGYKLQTASPDSVTIEHVKNCWQTFSALYVNGGEAKRPTFFVAPITAKAKCEFESFGNRVKLLIEPTDAMKELCGDLKHAYTNQAFVMLNGTVVINYMTRAEGGFPTLAAS
jgi:hypothetical protein